MSKTFRENSRYYNQKTETITTKDGRKVSVLTLRVIKQRPGKTIQVKPTDRLDVLAYYLYKDSTRFWHIADANTELDSTKLIKADTKTLEVPEI